MKNKLAAHKGSAIVMCVSTALCIYSGMKSNMKLHKCSAAAMCISGLICMCSGYQMVNPSRKKDKE